MDGLKTVKLTDGGKPATRKGRPPRDRKMLTNGRGARKQNWRVVKCL